MYVVFGIFFYRKNISKNTGKAGKILCRFLVNNTKNKYILVQ